MFERTKQRQEVIWTTDGGVISTVRIDQSVIDKFVVFPGIDAEKQAKKRQREFEKANLNEKGTKKDNKQKPKTDKEKPKALNKNKGKGAKKKK